MGAVCRGVLKVVEDLHLAPPLHQDADRAIRTGLGDKLAVRIVRWQEPRIKSAFDRMAKGVHSKLEASHALIGVNPHAIAGVHSAIEHARTRNVELVTNASRDFLDQVRQVLTETEGQSLKDIRAALRERVGVAQSRAQLIARDQTTKLNGDINEHRQRAAGVKKFTWSTSKDERVRRKVEWSASDGRGGDAAHMELDGEVFGWDDLPVLDGEPTRCGQAINCRCVAIPFVDDLDGEGEEEGSEEEGAEGDEPDEEEGEGEGEEEEGLGALGAAAGALSGAGEGDDEEEPDEEETAEAEEEAAEEAEEEQEALGELDEELEAADDVEGEDKDVTISAPPPPKKPRGR
jgi:SPP1 gp7 family putative phage head morphogenesis protein